MKREVLEKQLRELELERVEIRYSPCNYLTWAIESIRETLSHPKEDT